MGNFGKCRSCGAQIIWIKTKAGKNMPCNAKLVSFRYPKEGEKGTQRIVLAHGEVVSVIEEDSDKADGQGYISHFASCPNANKHRRR